MSRWVLMLGLFACLQWARPAAAEQLPGAFDASGIVAMPLVTLGALQLGHFIDTKTSTAYKGTSSSTYTKLFFVLGTGAMYPAMYGLAKATRVPVTWGSAAVGMGFGALTGIGLLALDVGIMALFDIKGKSTGAGILAFGVVVGWSVATTLFIKADPFHLTRNSSSMAQMSAPLVSFTF